MLGHSLNCYISYCNFKGSVNLSPVWLAEAFFIVKHKASLIVCNSHVELIAMNPIMRLSCCPICCVCTKATWKPTRWRRRSSLSLALRKVAPSIRQQQDNLPQLLQSQKTAVVWLDKTFRNTPIATRLAAALLCLVFDTNCLHSRFHPPCTGKKKNERWLFKKEEIARGTALSGISLTGEQHKLQLWLRRRQDSPVTLYTNLQHQRWGCSPFRTDLPKYFWTGTSPGTAKKKRLAARQLW